MGWAERLVVSGIRLYQRTLSPLKGPTCRFVPSCSEYAAQAVALHGLWTGGWLALRRLFRCHPWGAAGYDPVPDVGTVRGGTPSTRIRAGRELVEGRSSGPCGQRSST